MFSYALPIGRIYRKLVANSSLFNTLRRKVDILFSTRCGNLKEASKLRGKGEDSLRHWKEECEAIDRMNLSGRG